MNSVRIVADSGCDLPANLVELYQITRAGLCAGSGRR